ncbi:helix-turn-helix domain-containing protein [Rhodococcus sp. (in: high G+C Gram-positive bacteria)]|uniref:helix-turn-helix domain-containing protein n=1 Tax=Rhodococcus sp. TaxID=1831 RepID=UPI001A2F99C6|nr:helix-turn-helix domain-containing protein [Rhodococcus sp. (in: high G+C Gram-positive bacteria)]MBJ7481548.1 helix-turn-helix domain-containing protein [Rhodococcus sp. (in: high G+C Gram-positive bacteria)]
MATAWTDEESTRLTELHAAGKSLHFIAGELGRSKETVSRWASTLGVSFSREKTAKAAEAVHVDNKARRALLESRLLTEAEKVIEQLWTPAIVYSFGGQFNEYAEHELDKPTFSDQKAIMQTASTAITASNKLHEMNAGQNTDHAKSMLVQMQEALLKAVEAEEGGE